MISDILGLPTKNEVKIDGETWEFEILRPRDRGARASLVSQILGGASLESVSQEDHGTALMVATLKVICRSAPTWFREKFWPEGSVYPQFENFPDEEYMLELYNAAMAKETAFAEAKKKLRSPKISPEPKMGGRSAPAKDVQGTADLPL